MRTMKQTKLTEKISNKYSGGVVCYAILLLST